MTTFIVTVDEKADIQKISKEISDIGGKDPQILEMLNIITFNGTDIELFRNIPGILDIRAEQVYHTC